MTVLEQTFTKDLINRTQKAIALGANGKRFLSQLEKDGGVRVMQNLIRRQQVSDVFDGLEKAGQLALSPEAAVTQSVYGALFTDDEVNWCFQQLCDAGYFG
ncbi:MAG TPA: hypothetical protein IAA80_01730 [Candidatus Gallacutalibacter pullistercoris]|nr:hypothetical protein [Candidatus Gallacutalibacter pullistercoris]